ncbi:universal stress protein [Candidatus Nitrososphaera sp. FF02]|uniref:universal stress protein n=1 Tax=Candidatus Nitrososphaera sp. FF02 TaxID=3398226 RepID=UPI0039ECE2F8
MFKKVLVAIDGSECAERAFEKALEMTAPDGTLSVIHVLHLPLSVSSKKPVDFETFFKRGARSFLVEHQKKAATRGLKADTILIKGNPAEAILNAATSTGADLIIIGSRGQGGIKGLMLGSVSSAVVQHAKIPVLVVR